VGAKSGREARRHYELGVGGRRSRSNVATGNLIAPIAVAGSLRGGAHVDGEADPMDAMPPYYSTATVTSIRCFSSVGTVGAHESPATGHYRR